MTDNGKRELTDRQKRAIDALLRCPTIRSAALMAGIAERTLHRYIRMPHVKVELSRRQDGILAATSAALAGLSQHAIEALTQSLDILVAQAQADVGDFITVRSGEDTSDADEKGAAWAVDLASASDADLLHLVKKLTTDKDGSDRLELHDAQGAAIALGRLAVSILEQRRKSVELDDLADRITALEEVT